MVTLNIELVGVSMELSDEEWEDAIKYLRTVTYAYPVPIPDYGEW